MTTGLVVDAHVHLGPPKYAPVDDYLAAMAGTGIDAAVLVQHLGNSDNRYLRQVVSAHPRRFVALAIVDDLDEVGGVLDEGFVGLRLGPGGLPGRDGPEVFDVLEDRSATVSVTGPFDQVVSPRFVSTVRHHPHVGFRLEHLGWLRYGPGSADPEAFGLLLRLADEPNVGIMWSGFFANAGTDYPYPDALLFLARTLTAFTSERVMWSGDWNRAGLAADDYRRALELADRWGLDDDQRLDVLGRSAARFFGLHPALPEGAI